MARLLLRRSAYSFSETHPAMHYGSIIIMSEGLGSGTLLETVKRRRYWLWQWKDGGRWRMLRNHVGSGRKFAGYARAVSINNQRSDYQNTSEDPTGIIK